MVNTRNSSSRSLHTSEHHPTLYFDDGNVVLVALTASCSTQRFRIHKSYLSTQSSVFADMFSLPSSPTANAGEIYDGVPLVHMQDSAEDIASLLRALYDPLFLPSKRRNPQTPLLLHGALKLAKKYEFHALRYRIVEYVQNQWPQTLQEWDTFQEEIRAMPDEGGVDYENGPWLEPVSAFHFAREAEHPDLMRMALYLLSTLPHDCQGARWDLMEHRDWMDLLRGQHTMWTNTFFADHVECQVKDALCGKSCRDGLQLAPKLNDDYLTFPFDTFSFAAAVYTKAALVSAGVCKKCTSIILKYAEKLRRETWDDMGEWFDTANTGQFVIRSNSVQIGTQIDPR